MMGKQPPREAKLFYYDVSLEQRIPKTHLLRKINDLLDLDFVYDLVEDCYGKKGNVSVPPPVIMKLMLLLFLYNVRSGANSVPFSAESSYNFTFNPTTGI